MLLILRLIFLSIFAFRLSVSIASSRYILIMICSFAAVSFSASTANCERTSMNERCHFLPIHFKFLSHAYVVVKYRFILIAFPVAVFATAMPATLLSMSNMFKAYRNRDIKIKYLCHSFASLNWMRLCLKSSQPLLVRKFYFDSSHTNKCEGKKCDRKMKWEWEWVKLKGGAKKNVALNRNYMEDGTCWRIFNDGLFICAPSHWMVNIVCQYTNDTKQQPASLLKQWWTQKIFGSNAYWELNDKKWK